MSPEEESSFNRKISGPTYDEGLIEAPVVPIRENSLDQVDPHLEPQSKPQPKPVAVKKSADLGSSVKLTLPNALLNRSRDVVRRHRTGGDRALGAGFVVHSYIEAVDELLRKTDIDVYGIERGDQKEMTDRVKKALAQALAVEQ